MIHPFTSAHVVSFIVDSVIRIATCPFVVGLVTQRCWKRQLYVRDISCVRFMQSFHEGEERMLPYFKVDSFGLLPCTVSLKGLEFQFQIHFLLATCDEESHSVTISIHLKIRKLRLEFMFLFQRFWEFCYTFLCQYLVAKYKKIRAVSPTCKNHGSESNTNFSYCVGTDGYNFLSIFVDGITTMIHIQVNPSGEAESNTELQDTDRIDSLPTTEASKRPRKESKRKQEEISSLLVFVSHVLKQVVITNINLNIIGSLHKNEIRNNSDHIEYQSGISIGVEKVGVVSATDNASLTATSCLDFQALSIGLFGAMHRKEKVGVTTDTTYVIEKSTYMPTPLLLECSSKEVLNISIPNFTALWTIPKMNKRIWCRTITSNNTSSLQAYQLLTAVFVTSPLSSNDCNLMMEDLLPPMLLQDIELRLGVTNAAFLVESLLPNVIDFIQQIPRRRSTTHKSQKQQNEPEIIPKHSKPPLAVFPIKEAWLGFGLKVIIMDDAIRPSSSKSEHGLWVCHTVVRATFQTTTEILSAPFNQHEATSSIEAPSSRPEMMSESHMGPIETEPVRIQELSKSDYVPIRPLAQILSISCLNLSLSLESGPQLFCIQDIEMEFQNHFSTANQSIQIINTSQGEFSTIFISKQVLWAQIGLVKAYLPLRVSEAISIIISTFPQRGKVRTSKPKQKSPKPSLAHSLEATLKCSRLDFVLLDDRHNGAELFRWCLLVESLQSHLRLLPPSYGTSKRNEMECNVISESIFISVDVTSPSIPLINPPSSSPDASNRDVPFTLIGFLQEFSGNLLCNDTYPEGKGDFLANKIWIQEFHDQTNAENATRRSSLLESDTRRAQLATALATFRSVRFNLYPLITPHEQLYLFADLDGATMVGWNAMLQLKILFAIHTTTVLLKDLKNYFSTKKSVLSSEHHINVTKPKKPDIHFEIRGRDVIHLHAFLGNGNKVVATLNGLVVHLKTLSMRRKPDISVSATQGTVYLNDHLTPAVEVENLLFQDFFRTAFDSEILAYEQKKNVGITCLDISDDLAVDLDGSPLFETINLSASNVIFRVAPNLHFGQVLDDFEKTMKGLQLGLAFVGIKKHHTNRCYQLMSITSTFMRVDASILDGAHEEINASQYCHRFRAIFRCLDVSIDRNDPPSYRKAYLNELDEDPSEFRDYGPPIQGGFITASIKKAVVLVDPLTLSVPLAVIKNLQWNGAVMIAGISPQSMGLFGGRDSYVPIYSSFYDGALCKQYGFQVSSKGIPPKFYIDGNLNVRELSVNFGLDIQAVLPQILSAIDRLKPPSSSDESSAPSLGWWDSLRFFIHGNISCSIGNISFCWLLDSIYTPEWSIMLESDGFNARQSVGHIVSEFTSLVVSVPRDSYPLQTFDTKILDASRSGLWHSLILIPTLHLDLTYSWIVFSAENSSPMNHHSPYQSLSEDGNNLSGDKFRLFRSHGISVCLKSDISVDNIISNWIALRIDVLPWLTHNGHRFAELSKAKPSLEKKKPSPKLELSCIDVTLSMSQLKVAVWHGPFDTKGVCFVITGATVTRVDGPMSSLMSKKNELHLEKVQAVLLVAPQYEDITQLKTFCGMYAPDFGALEKFDQLSAFMGASRDERAADPNALTILPFIPTGKPEEGTSMFYALQVRLEKTCAVDYLVEVSSILLRDQSLVKCCKGPYDADSVDEFHVDASQLSPSRHNAELFLDKDERSWTVLVCGMKLLWTIDIRDAVVLLVGDFMRTSELMKLQLKVSSRSQKKPADISKKVPHNVHFNLTSTHSCDDVYSVDNAFQHEERKSSLLRLLENIENDEDNCLNDTMHSSERPAEIFHAYSGSDAYDDSDDASIESDTSPCFPVLVIHLFNPQIQLHSEQTGGGIILAMRRCYVEGNQFYKYFADYSFDCTDSNFNEANPKVLRKKEFLYQLDEVEAFAVNTEVDVDVGLQWLDLGEAVDADKISSSYVQSGDTFESYSPRHFLCEVTMRKIIKSFSFHTRQLFFRQPLDLSPDEIASLFQSRSIISVGGPFGSHCSVMDSVEVHLDQLSFELDSNQFSTTMDLLKNVLLAPPPMPRKLHSSNPKTANKIPPVATVTKFEGKKSHKMTVVVTPTATRKTRTLDVSDESDSSISSRSHSTSDNGFGTKSAGEGEPPPTYDELQRIVFGWHDSQHRKRDRDTLRVAIENLLSVLEDEQSDLRLIRNIEWSLSKASWKIYSPDVLDDVEIELTSLRGTHQFFSDSSMTTQLELEDLRINSLKPSAEAMNFNEPGAVLTTSLSTERSPCQRCGSIFDRASNYMHSCRYHAGKYFKAGGKWSCCGASLEGDAGCKSGPHTGKERVALVRVESLPKTIHGVSLYKHIEVNIYPEVPHTLIVQMTKSVSKLFTSYFIGDSIVPKGSVKQGLGDAQQTKTLGGDEDKSDVADALLLERGDSVKKRSTLFGKRKGTGSSNPSAVEEMKLSGSCDVDDVDSIPASSKTKKEEIVFVKHLRIGNINTEITLVGFPVETRDYGIGVPAFSRAYKIGTNSYLSRKYLNYVVHEVVKSIAHSGLTKVSTETQMLKYFQILP